jgi:hypothetical protein
MSITLPLESHLHRRTKTSVEIQYYPNKIVKDYAVVGVRRIYGQEREGSCNWLWYANFSHTGVIIVVAATMIITAV